MIYLSAFAVSFSYVFLKALQQLNVVHHKLLWIAPVSILMGLCEVFIISTVATNQAGFMVLVSIGVSLGFGGAAGAILAMILHKRLRHD